MYSKIQQQCLNELGIQAFELKPEFRTPVESDTSAFVEEDVADNVEQKVQPLDTAPAKNLLQNQDQSSQLEPKEDTSSVKSQQNAPWHLSSQSLLDDLSVLIPEFKIGEQSASFSSDKGQIEWQQVVTAMQPSLHNNTLTTKPLRNLTLSDKRDIWQLLQTLVRPSVD